MSIKHGAAMSINRGAAMSIKRLDKVPWATRSSVLGHDLKTSLDFLVFV